MHILTATSDVEALARQIASVPRIALDLEYNGLFVYRARVCTVQLAWEGNVAVIDAFEASLEPLRAAFGTGGPIKIMHDVGFDARMLAEYGMDLGNVHDTSIAARMLGHTSTGLLAVLAKELGVTISKELQSHDWGARPIAEDAKAYLTVDVEHLERLDDVLWARLRERGIEDEVLEETRYRIGTASDSARAIDPRRPYARVKGVERVSGVELAVLREVAEVREREAARRDVPPHRVFSAEAMLAVSSAKPVVRADLRRIRGIPAADPLIESVLAAVRAGIAARTIPDEERAWFERPKIAQDELRARRSRELRLTAWRKEEARQRGVDEQVVLPGHCLKDLAERVFDSVEELASVRGLGAFRIARNGGAIFAALNDANLPTDESKAP